MVEHIIPEAFTNIYSSKVWDFGSILFYFKGCVYYLTYFINPSNRHAQLTVLMNQVINLSMTNNYFHINLVMIRFKSPDLLKYSLQNELTQLLRFGISIMQCF